MNKQRLSDFSTFNETLISISTQLLDTPTSSLKEVMSSVLEECRQLLGVDRISCLPNTKYVTAHWQSYTVSGAHIPGIKQHISLDVKAQYQAMIHSGVILNSSTDPQLLTLAKQLQDQAPINHILIPIQAMGKPWGAFAAANFTTEMEFDEQFIRCSTILGNIMASSIQRLRHYQELSSQKEKVTALNKRLIEDSEKQLKVIARDLHDDFGQRLTGLNLELGFINSQLEPTAQKAMQKVAADLSTITRDLQHLSRHLHPAIIDRLGLHAAIESEAKKMAMRKNIHLSLNLSSAVLYNEEQKLHLYRICQEALANVARHSQATELSITLNCQGTMAMLTFIDNGIGLPLDSTYTTSLGIQSMRERAEIAGGSIEFNRNNSGTGCTITVLWPLPEDINCL